ncbi:MAG: ferrochelatase, partial [Elainella sp.]
MVATPEKTQQPISPSASLESVGSESVGSDRIAVLLMGYGEVESYDDFANYNEQALNLLTAKFAPVPTWIYPG